MQKKLEMIIMKKKLYVRIDHAYICILNFAFVLTSFMSILDYPLAPMMSLYTSRMPSSGQRQ